MGASRPQTPRCFLVLDYLFSSTRKLQFYVELAQKSAMATLLNMKKKYNFFHLIRALLLGSFYLTRPLLLGEAPPPS